MEGGDAAALVRARAGGEPVELALVLGSGLSALAEAVDGVSIPYDELPSFPSVGVSGHGAILKVGRLEGRRIAILAGRAHYYENGDPAAMRTPIATMRALGAGELILTNAAGSLRREVPPGGLMLIADHLNLAGANPLIGEATDARFVGMTEAYDPAIRSELRAAADAEGIPLAEGIYAWFSGPSFETPAEVRAAGVLGADAVGMSTVPEVILARFFGLRVGAIAAITNMAAGLGTETISHAHTKKMAPLGAVKIERVLRRYLASRSRSA